jgi:hypothetical protein
VAGAKTGRIAVAATCSQMAEGPRVSTEGPLAHIGGPGLERGSLVSALGVDEMSWVR